MYKFGEKSVTETEVDQGWALVKSKHYTDALKIFQLVLNTKPNASGALFGKAVCLEKQGIYEETIKIFQQLIEKDRRPAYLHRLARFYMKHRELDKALPIFKELAELKAFPEYHMSGYLGMADIYGAKGDFNTARSYFAKAQYEFPLTPTPFTTYIHWCREQGLMREALEFSEKVMFQHSNPMVIYAAHATVHYDIGNYLKVVEFVEGLPEKEVASSIALQTPYARALIELKRFDQALKVLEKLIKLEPNRPSIFKVKLICLQKMGKKEEAITFAKEVFLPSFQFSAGAYHILGKAYEEVGDLVSATETLSQALANGLTNENILQTYAHLLVKQGFVNEALTCLTKMCERYPNDMKVLLSYVITSEKVAPEILKKQQIKLDFERIIKQFPSRFEPLLSYANFLDKIGEKREALKQLLIAKQQFPDSPVVHLSYAIQLEDSYKKGMNHDAEAAYEEALEKFPFFVQGYLDYAGFLIKTGNFEQACNVLLAALKYAPSDKRVFGQLAIAYTNNEQHPNFLQIARMYVDKALALDPYYSPIISASAHLYQYRQSTKHNYNDKKIDRIFNKAYQNQPSRIEVHQPRQIAPTLQVKSSDPESTSTTIIKRKKGSPAQSNFFENSNIKKQVTSEKLLHMMTEDQLKAEYKHHTALLVQLEELGATLSGKRFVNWFSKFCSYLKVQALDAGKNNQFLSGCTKLREITNDVHAKLLKIEPIHLKELMKAAEEVNSDQCRLVTSDKLQLVNTLLKEKRYCEALSACNELISALENITTISAQLAEEQQIVSLTEVSGQAPVCGRENTSLVIIEERRAEQGVTISLTSITHPAGEDTSSLWKTAWHTLKYYCYCPSFFGSSSTSDVRGRVQDDVIASPKQLPTMTR